LSWFFATREWELLNPAGPRQKPGWVKGADSGGDQLGFCSGITRNPALNSLTCLTGQRNPDYHAHSMHASRFSFAFTYRYFYGSGGEADGVLIQK
jgi:hypothetical protein